MTGPESLFSTPRMSEIFSPRSALAAMLRFEAALARAQARAGVIPAQTAHDISAACDPDRFDLEALARDARSAGNLAIPMVRALTELVPEGARGYVHWGATSQDAVDTGLVLQVGEGLGELMEDLAGAGAACASLAEEHAATPMAGRSLLQHAVPITFGLKAARWLAALTGELLRLHALRAGLPVQLGGAVGTLAAMGEQAEHVRELLGEELGLFVPDLPWHTDRSPLGEVAAALALTAATVGKIATDVTLLAQTEVGEVLEAAEEGRGGSSTMPHKRNPVRGPIALAASRLALGSASVVLSSGMHEHERAVGSWQTEWAAIPQLFRSIAAAVREVRGLLEHLEVRPQRMRRNLESGGGVVMAESLMMALAPQLGRDRAHALVEGLVRMAERERTDLRTAAAADPEVRETLSPEAVDAALDPMGYMGMVEPFIRRAVGAFKRAADRMASEG